MKLEDGKDLVTAAQVRQEIKTDGKSQSFFKLAESYIEQLEKNGKYIRISSEKPRIKHFKEFVHNKDIDFREITVMLLKDFQAYLRNTRGISERTIVNHLIVIRTVFNLAVRENITEQKYYPFGKGKIVIKFPESVKLGLINRRSPNWRTAVTNCQMLKNTPSTSGYSLFTSPE